jgi:signal transduction histidine kinase
MLGGPMGRLSLSLRFALAGAVVLILGTMIIGSWVVARISSGVTANVAISTALVVDGLVTPIAQELKDKNVLSIGPVRALDELQKSAPLVNRVVGMRIWKPDGRVAYSNDFDMIGMHFTPSDELRRAIAGEVVASRDSLHDDESARVAALGVPLLEIYSPVRDRWTGEVLAVAEFYEDATKLEAMLAQARRQSWLVVIATMSGMGLLLFGVVHGGNRLIERQKTALQDEIERVAAMSHQNATLRERIERAYTLSTELNERYLRRVSADLHDGPAQLVGLASLRIGSLRDSADEMRRRSEAGLVQQVLGEAMSDIRTICHGLSLPQIENQSLTELLWDAVRSHERRTGTKVELSVCNDDLDLPVHLKICCYRFVQEGLNNAFRHAGGNDQSVLCHLEHGVLHLSVTNGPYRPDHLRPPNERKSLGLEGLQGRLEALGGRFHFETFPQTGSRLEMSVQVERIAA